MKLLDDAVASSSGSVSTLWEYSGNETPGEISFANDSGGDIQLNISKYIFTVRAGESLDVSFPTPFYEIGITTTGAYRLMVGA